MSIQKFRLKNMLSKSCVKLIQLSFDKVIGVEVRRIQMGEVELEANDKKISISQLETHFNNLGFSIVLDPDSATVEKIKLAAVELIHFAFNTNSLIRNSDYISEKVQLPYDKLSKLFSRVTNTTLEKYIILLKIEKAKELISNEEFSLSEISFMLGYSSVQYLSNQFKKITGITVSEFKENPDRYRKPLEDLL